MEGDCTSWRSRRVARSWKGTCRLITYTCVSVFHRSIRYRVAGYIKGKSAISIARKFTGKTKNFTGENFWAGGYFVSTGGLDEEMVREYIRHQEKEDEHYDQIKLHVMPP